MKSLLPIVFAIFIGSPVNAEPVLPDALLPAGQGLDPLDLTQFFWKNRVLVVFADSPNDPSFIEQIGLLAARPQDLIDRELVILTDTDPANPSKLREKLRPRGFMLMLLAKDGKVYLRKPRPWTSREITRSIDKMPIRRQEMRNR